MGAGVKNTGSYFKKAFSRPGKLNIGEVLDPGDLYGQLTGKGGKQPGLDIPQYSEDQINADRKSILDETETQRNLLGQRRAELGKALQTQAEAQFMDQLPRTAEQANAGGIYTGTGFSDALAREKGLYTRDVANNMSVAAGNDVGNEIQGRNAALSRGFSLRDYNQQARIAQALAAAGQPVPQNNMMGNIMSGAGTGAAVGGPWGAVAGGLLGALQGNDAYKGRGR